MSTLRSVEINGAEEAQAALPGPLAKRYRLDAVLGQGVSGWVGRAHDRRLDRDVAIKVFHRHFLQRGGNAVERFRREARYAAKLRHPRIARIHDQGITERTLFIIYELVEGQTLSAHLLRGGEPLAVPEATRLFVQLLEAIAAMEAEGIVHRDLKPENILMTPEGDLVVTDLGLARSSLDDTITRTGGVVGTPSFMAPEQMEGGEPGHDWDLYAAASVYWELLTGEVPFWTRNLVELRERKFSGMDSGLRDRGLDVPPELDAMVLRMLSPERELRPRSAAEILPVARRAQEAASEPAPPREPTREPPRPPPRRELPADSAAPTEEALRPTGAVPTRRTSPPPVMLGALGVLLLGLGFLAGWSARAPSPAPPTQDGGDVAPLSNSVPEALGTLRRARRAVDEARPVRAFLGLPPTASPREGEHFWEEARAAFVQETARLAPAVAVLLDAPPSAEVHAHAARLRLLELLLTEIGTTRSAPLEWPAEVPDLTGLLGRTLRARPAPLLSGHRRPSTRPGERLEDRGDFVHRLRARLPGGETAWSNLFDFFSPWKTEEGRPSHSLMPRALTERPFEPLRAPGDAGMLEGLFRSRQSYAGVPDEVLLDLRETPGDLDLAILVSSWPAKVVLTLEVWTTSGTTALVPVAPPRPEDVLPPTPAEGPVDENPVVGLLLRLSREALGAPPAWARLVPRGVQAVGNPSFSVWLLDVHQRSAIPPPPELERLLGDHD